MEKAKIIMIVVLALTILVWAGKAGAAGPMGSYFSYQGELTDAGHPADGTYDFRFRLYDEADGGAERGPIAMVEDVGVSNGRFTVNVDFTDDPNVFNGEGRWLEISVRPGDISGPGDFTPLNPRQELTAGPYAQFAKYAGGIIPGGPGASTNAWKLTGNSGTTPGTNFVGTKDNKALEFKVNSKRVLRIEPVGFSPNIIAGSYGNWISAGADAATISGGGTYVNSWFNRVTDRAGTVSGGYNNQAGDNAGDASDSALATVGGGTSNTASGGTSTVSGGGQNTASGTDCTVAGGRANTASGTSSAVGGGTHNIADAFAATVPGGSQNTATGDFSFAAGHMADANHNGSFVWADSGNGYFSSTGADQFLIRASRGVGIGTTNPTAQLTVNGVVHSIQGGFKFPDGTVQTSASTAGPGSGNTLDQAYDQGGPGAGKRITTDSGAVQITGAGGLSIIGSGGLSVTGNVGIGTPVGASKLEVDGIVHSTSGGFKFPDGSIQTSTTAGDGSSLDSPDGSHPDVITVDNSGDVKIGSDNPGGRLTVAETIHSESGGFVFPDGTIQTSAAPSPGPEHAASDAEPRWVVALDTQGECQGPWNLPIDLPGGRPRDTSKVLDLTWSFNRSYNPETCSVSTSKRHNVVTIVKNIDKASPCLAAHLARGVPIQHVRLIFLSQSPIDPKDAYYVIHLTEAQVVSFKQIMRHRGNGEYAHLDEVSFSYLEIRWEWADPHHEESDVCGSL